MRISLIYLHRQWYVIMDGIVAATNHWSRFFFISFWCTAVAMVRHSPSKPRMSMMPDLNVRNFAQFCAAGIEPCYCIYLGSILREGLRAWHRSAYYHYRQFRVRHGRPRGVFHGHEPSFCDFGRDLVAMHYVPCSESLSRCDCGWDHLLFVYDDLLCLCFLNK